MELSELVAGVEAVRATSRKGEKVDVIASLLCRASGRSRELLALYLTGTLPQGRIGVGWRALQKVSAQERRQAAPLTLEELDRAFSEVAGLSGQGSVKRREQLLQTLFAQASRSEQRFLFGLLMGEVRQGALDGLVQDSIARAAHLDLGTVRRATMFAPSLGEVARVALEEGANGLSRFTLRVLAPVAPMLASPADGPEDALERLGEAAFEYKLDGARIQVHKAGDEVKVFTRQLQDVTGRVPEIVEWARSLSPPALVVEGEALVLRPDGRPHPFQVTMRRLGRSKDVVSARAELPLSFFLFDCLFEAGDGPLVGLPYVERMSRLEGIVGPEHRLPRIVTGAAEEARAFFRGAIEAGHEGVMAKSLVSPYEAGQRGFHWLKLKAAHTLDLVVLAAEWGSGRRKGWLSNLHLGARDPASGQFVMLGKTFKGLTDETLAWQTERLKELLTSSDGFVVHVRPELVVEIAFSEVQESPRYPAGLALRFARVKRYRPDKSAQEADLLSTVREIFDRQRA